MSKKFAFKSGSNENKENTREAIRNREEFQTGGSLRGELTTDWPLYAGRLDRDEVDLLRSVESNKKAELSYVIISYSTPIAWYFEIAGLGFWHIVSQKFSISTTIQQNFVRFALKNARLFS